MKSLILLFVAAAAVATSVHATPNQPPVKKVVTPKVANASPESCLKVASNTGVKGYSWEGGSEISYDSKACDKPVTFSICSKSNCEGSKSYSVVTFGPGYSYSAYTSGPVALWNQKWK